MLAHIYECVHTRITDVNLQLCVSASTVHM